MKFLTISKRVIGTETINSINGRELHKELGLKSDFSTWIKRELKFFTLDTDYIKLHKKVELSRTGQIGIDYILTLDTAKHLAMLQRNDKGMIVRQYFIDVEKQSRQPQPQIGRDIKECLEVADIMAKMFNVEGTEKIKMVSTVLKANKHDDFLNALPTYQSTKFVGTIGEVSERVAHAYSYHKEQNPMDYTLSAVMFNKRAEKLGVIETARTRSGKKFKVIKSEFLQYGKNIVASQASTKTQIHWFDDSFDTMYWAIDDFDLGLLAN